jgi:uncharacterized protein (UPF0332 family)
MASWLDIAKENSKAGNYLYSNMLYRAAINRYYYAAFHLLTDQLIQAGVKPLFYKQRETPGHVELPALISQHLVNLSQRKRDHLADAIRRLYRRRETADYTDTNVDEQYCKESRRFLLQVTYYLGVVL